MQISYARLSQSREIIIIKYTDRIIITQTQTRIITYKLYVSIE